MLKLIQVLQRLQGADPEDEIVAFLQRLTRQPEFWVAVKKALIKTQ